MTQHTFKQNMLDEPTDVHAWSALLWPLAQGNPFLSLADPGYTGRMLKERAVTLARMAVPRAHTVVDPRELPDVDIDSRRKKRTRFDTSAPAETIPRSRPTST